MIERSKHSTFIEINSILPIVNRYDIDIIHVVEVGVGGPTVCRASELMGETRKVDLFEPNPRLCQELRNAFINVPNVTIHEVAISSQVGEMDFYDRNASGFLKGSISPYLINGGKDFVSDIVKVKTSTFDVFDDGTIDLLMVDVEGSEWHVINYLKSRPYLICLEMMGGGPYVNPCIREIATWMHKEGYKSVCLDDSDVLFVKHTITDMLEV